MFRVNRNKIKVTYIDPGAGIFGMHDGWGSWDKTRFHRPLGILLCKKHFTIPSKSWSDFSQCYIFTCETCSEEEKYKLRKNRILADRAKGRHSRMKENEEGIKIRQSFLNALKEVYSAY